MEMDPEVLAFCDVLASSTVTKDVSSFQKEDSI
jgi:hypothetical protein